MNGAARQFRPQHHTTSAMPNRDFTSVSRLLVEARQLHHSFEIVIVHSILPHCSTSFLCAAMASKFVPVVARHATRSLRQVVRQQPLRFERALSTTAQRRSETLSVVRIHSRSSVITHHLIRTN